MTLSELLKQQGLDDETVTKITEAMKANKIYTAGEENLDIRYGKLKGDHEALSTQLTEANALIEQLKQGSKGNEKLQGKISEYESTVEQLKAENERLKIESAAKVKLLNAKADDIDYLMWKMKESGELKLGEDGEIVGIDGIVSDLQSKYPSHFGDSANGNGKIVEKKLDNPQQQQTGTISKEDFNKMGYMERAKLHKENPEAYNELAGK